MIERPSFREATSCARASEREMEGERVLRELEPPRDVACGHAVRSALHEQAEDLQPALLRQRAQRSRCGG